MRRAEFGASPVSTLPRKVGHSDLSTTLGIYGHRDLSDLEREMDAYARWKPDEASGIVPANESGDRLG